MDIHDWPEVPEQQRPKKLYINAAMPALERVELATKGWEVVDTRILPGHTDQERLEAVKAVLEGIRIGSIEPDKNMKDFLDQELYILGVKGKGAQATDRGDLAKNELDLLLDFQGSRVSSDFRERLRELNDEPKKKVTKKKKEVK